MSVSSDSAVMLTCFIVRPILIIVKIFTSYSFSWLKIDIKELKSEPIALISVTQHFPACQGTMTSNSFPWRESYGSVISHKASILCTGGMNNMPFHSGGS